MLQKPASDVKRFCYVLATVVLLAPSLTGAALQELSPLQVSELDRWRNLRRMNDTLQREFMILLKEKKDERLARVAGESLMAFQEVLMREPIGENNDLYITSVEMRYVELYDVALSIGRRRAGFEREILQLKRTTRDLMAKIASMSYTKAGHPPGLVNVTVVAVKKNGSVSGIFIVHQDEASFEKRKPPLDTGRTPTQTIQIPPGYWLFFEKGKRPADVLGTVRADIGSKGFYYLVEWRVK